MLGIVGFSVALVQKLGQATINPRWRAAMQRIEDWLKKLGMSEYSRRFTEKDIDTSVLRHLTDQDLKELGHINVSRTAGVSDRSPRSRRFSL
jgi:SAM domain (Sterile alpha motif)